MKNRPTAIFFDKNDYQLLQIVRDVLEKGSQSSELRVLLGEHMHPQGIQEMAAPKGLRIAYAIASLLGSFDSGRVSDRIKALRSLRDEVLFSSTSEYKYNTARVLIQIMKNLLRSSGNELRQLKLAHDFRMVSTGNPRLVRAELSKYHLLEMPEEWNQYAFDDHVHDANTKGRKSPTHLIMDAWIKGIRFLEVVYYNYVSPEVVEELIETSAILDVKIQVGIEMSCRFRDKYVRFTWEPHGFNANRASLKFLKQDAVKKLMEEGRAVSHYQQKYVFEVLEVFNDRHRKWINDEYEISLPAVDSTDFLAFVGAGQPSILHLARFIQNALFAYLKETASLVDGKHQDGRKESLWNLNVETIIEQFLLPGRNPELHDPNRPRESEDLPELLRLKPKALLRRLLALHSSSRFSLNLSNLSAQDALELLYICKGMITHIEAYNLKDAAHGMNSGVIVGEEGVVGEVVDLKSPEQHYSIISDLQTALNDDNVISLKRCVRAIIWDFEEQCHNQKEYIETLPADKSKKQRGEDQLQKMKKRKRQLVDILYNLESFHNYYLKRMLGSRIGSDSTGQAEHQHGMGLVVVDTLPARARRAVDEAVVRQERSFIPISALLTRNSHRRCYDRFGMAGKKRSYKKLPLINSSIDQRWQDWRLDGFLVHPGTPGNIVTLGGLGRPGGVGKRAERKKGEKRLKTPFRYLNTNLKNSLKVVIGFIPAFLTFSLTKDWWLLAYCGAFIWFGITGTRNIIQSVLGGGGMSRSPLLPWNSLVSWSRISDSLLYTGFSVPLLDYLVKTVLLERAMGITVATDPILLYSVMGLANGMYISGHNIFRGLPKAAAAGNFFRSILAIPLAVLLNILIGLVLQFTGIPDTAVVLQKWAAIISKFASDCVAAVIEGLADRQANIQARLAAYRNKISQLFGVFARLEVHFPEEDVLEMLQSPKMTMETLNYEAREQEKLIIVNALDLMYFWLYQPRARKALTIIFQQMTEEEWLIFYRSQLVLKRYREISQFFVDGLVGKKFSRPLSFYLERSEQYLLDLKKLGLTKEWV